MDKPIVFMSDFKPFHYSLPIAQQILLDYSAWLLASAQCSKFNVESPEEAEKIFSSMQNDMGRFGVSPKFVSKRELNSLQNVFSEKDKRFNTDYFPEIYANLIENYQGIDLNSRLAIYEKLVFEVMDSFYNDAENDLPDDIIHATCTGYLSPSPIQKLLSSKGWSDITVTHSYQMGCYGAIPPLRMAVGFLSSNSILSKQKKRVDILHTEYSSLHFQAINSAPDQIVSMTLFGDGFIKYSVTIESSIPNKRGLKILATQDTIISASLNEMTLIPGPYAFEMWLSKNVPLRIRDGIYAFVVSLCKQVGLDFDEVKDDLIFALHPGGPKIIDHIKEQLQLSEQQVQFSKKILYEHGNMVSATLPYIWKEIIDDPKVLPGTKVVSIAFGPGITIAGFMLEKV